MLPVFQCYTASSKQESSLLIGGFINLKKNFTVHEKIVKPLNFSKSLENEIFVTTEISSQKSLSVIQLLL